MLGYINHSSAFEVCLKYLQLRNMQILQRLHPVFVIDSHSTVQHPA